MLGTTCAPKGLKSSQQEVNAAAVLGPLLLSVDDSRKGNENSTHHGGWHSPDCK